MQPGIPDLSRGLKKRIWRRRYFKFIRLPATFLALICGTSVFAQSSAAPHCTLVGGLIDLGPSSLSYFLNDAKIKEAETDDDKTASSVGAAGANDWLNSDLFGDTCNDGGLAGAVRCQVTEPMANPNIVLMPNVPSPETEGPLFQTLERKIDPNAESSVDDLVLMGNSKKESGSKSVDKAAVKDLAEAKVKVTVPVRRLMRPGNPPAIYTVPAGPPSYDTSGEVGPAAVKRAREAMKANLSALISAAPFKVEGQSLSQIMAGGAGYTIPIKSSDKDNLFITAPISNGAKLPKACIPLLQKADQLDRISKALRDKKNECRTVASNIKAREKENAKGGVIDIVAQFVRADERLNRLKKRKETCERELKAISRAHLQAKDAHDGEVDKLSEAQHDRRIAAIKADPKRLAEEEAKRQDAAIDTAAAWVKHDEKIQRGMLAYEKNLKKYDDEIAALAASDDPDKAAKIKQLEIDRDRYLLAYDSWLERMVAIKHNRWKDHNRAFEQNRKDGIGPTNDDELDARIRSAGNDPEAVIRARFPDQEFARRDQQEPRRVSQADKDARSLGGNIGREPSFGELSVEVAKDVLTMTDFERAQNLYTYGPSAAKGTGEAVAEGLTGLYDLGKGAIDLNAELMGREGFEGSTTEKVVRFGQGIDDLGQRGTDDRLNERGYFENFNDNLENLVDAGGGKLERKFENLAGQGERGAKEATRLFAKGGTMVVGGEGAVLQGLGRAGQAVRGLGSLNKADDAARVVDKAGDLARAGDAAGNPAGLADEVAEANRARRALDDGVEAGPNRTASDDGLGTVSVNKAEQAAENAALREAYATEAPLNPAQSRSVDPSKTTTDISPGGWQDMLPFGAPPKFASKTPARQAQDALEAAGVDPNLARVFGARAGARDADAAIAAGAFESGVNPARLYENGSITQDGLRNGLKNYLTEMGVAPENQAAAINRYMNQKPPASAAASPTVAPEPRAPQGGGKQAAEPTLASEAPVNSAAKGLVPERGHAGRYSRAELDRRLAADQSSAPEGSAPRTERYTPEDIAAAQAAPNTPRVDPAATQRLTPEELAGAEAPLRSTDTGNQQAPLPSTARMSPEGLPSPDAPTVRMTAAEKAAQQAAETKKARTERFTPEDIAAAQAAPNTPRVDPAATQRLTPEELAGAEAPLRSTANEPSPVQARPSSSQSAALPGPEDATKRLSPGQLAETLKGANKPAIVPTDPQPVRISPTPEGNIKLEHAGRQIEVSRDLQIGQGATSTVYGADGKPNVLKAGSYDPLASHLDDLGREQMTGVVPIPELRGRYDIAPGSNLNGGISVSGGRLSVLERGPEPFSEAANALEKAGQSLGADRKAALNTFLEPLNRKGVVVTDLKADNIGFRPSTNPNNTNALDLVPLDDGTLIVLKPEFAHKAPAMQRALLDPGDVARNMRRDLGQMMVRERMADFDQYVDWDVMNGSLPDRPVRTLGGGEHGLPYTPNLGLRFSGLAD